MNSETDLGTRATTGQRPDTGGPGVVRAWRGLPSGRAVVGGFLVMAAAVGLFIAYLSATAAPGTRYAVAIREIPAGTELDGSEFRFLGLDLPGPQGARAVPEAEADQLQGLTTVGPVGRDDLLLRSNLVDEGGAPGAHQLSFAVPASRSLGGQLRPGERIDVLATYGGEAGRAYTVVVARNVQLLDVVDGAGAELGEGGRILTVAADDATQTAALAHAATQADLVVARSGDPRAPSAGPYRPPGP